MIRPLLAQSQIYSAVGHSPTTDGGLTNTKRPRGAVGAILLHTDQSAGYPWSVVRTSNGSWRFDIARSGNDTTPFLKIRSWMTDDAGRRMIKLAGRDLDELRAKAAARDFQPVKLGLKGKIDLKSEVKRVEAPNVAGILRGRDPKLRY